MKRVVALVLSCIILVLSCPVIVFAHDTSSDDELFFSEYFDENGNLSLSRYADMFAYANNHSNEPMAKKILGMFDYLCLRAGYSTIDHWGNLYKSVSNFLTGGAVDDYIIANVKMENSKRKFQYTDRFTGDIMNFLHTYVETNQGYYWSNYIDKSALPKSISAGAYDFNKNTYANNNFDDGFQAGSYDDVYSNFLNNLDNAFVSVYSYNGKTYFSNFSYYTSEKALYLVAIDSPKSSGYNKRSRTYYLDNNKLVQNGPVTTGARQYDYGVNLSFSNSGYKTTLNISQGQLILCYGYNTMYTSYTTDYFVGSPRKIFYTLADLYSYLQGNIDAYTYTPFNKKETPSSKDISIDFDKLLGIDWSTILSNLSTTINNNLNLGDLEVNYQNTIDAAFKDVLDVINDVKNEQLDQGQTLDQILANINAQGSNQSSWLSKIYLLLLDRLPIKSFDDTTTNPGTGGSSDNNTGGTSGAYYTDYLEKIINLLDENGKTLEDIKSNTSKLVALLAVDTGLNFFDILSAKLTASNDTLKSKFPTSIPWDLVAIFNLFKADPEAPVFDLPIEIQSLDVKENIHIDLSENSTVSNMSTVSKISRSMLTATFIMFLVVLTRNLFGGDK